jgi:GTP-dependent phosphoenolpyruvate carboxykinase
MFIHQLILNSEIPDIKEYYAKFGDRLPATLSEELASLEKRLHELEVDIDHHEWCL